MHGSLRLGRVALWARVPSLAWACIRIEWVAQGGLVISARRRHYVLRAGWGWDDQTPIRPWPVLRRPTEAGHAGPAVVFLGAFVAVNAALRLSTYDLLILRTLDDGPLTVDQLEGRLGEGGFGLDLELRWLERYGYVRILPDGDFGRGRWRLTHAGLRALLGARHG